MTTRPSAEAIAQRIPTRPVCHKCQRYITIDTEADDDLWAEVIGEKFGPGYICADCFTRAADERLIRWEDRVRLIPYSLASQIGVQNEAARELDAGREVYGPRSNGDMVVALLVAGGFVSEDKAAQAREIVAELSHPQAAEVGEEMVRDAARYRLLRHYNVDCYIAAGKLESLDRQVDAALEARKPDV